MNKTAIQNFNSLSLIIKAKLVVKFGIGLFRIVEIENYSVALYHLEEQFVEVWYCKKCQRIENVHMPDYKELSLHLQNIYIDPITFDIWSK